MKKLIFDLSILFLLFSCARHGKINLQEHVSGRTPKKIIWLQIDGLTTEQLGLLKFNQASVDERFIFEDAICMGAAWRFNHYVLRPSQTASFLSQLTGKKDFKNTCDDYEKTPLWDYLSGNGFQSIVLENGVNAKSSLVSSLSCKKDYLRNTALVSMRKISNHNGIKFFNAKKSGEVSEGNIYYDESCQQGTCNSALIENVNTLFDQLNKNNANYFLLVRDFTLANLISRKKISNTREYLYGLSKTIQLLVDRLNESSDALILVTGGSPKNIELPRSGKEWRRFEKSGKYVLYKKDGVLSPVFAFGARAENFCGLYEESDVFNRIITSPTDKKFNYYLLLPFR